VPTEVVGQELPDLLLPSGEHPASWVGERTRVSANVCSTRG
jgi:hypothetical protein